MDTPAVDLLELAPGLAIPRSELTFRATRSGGPGGQHVNTSSTRVELTWDVGTSPSLTDEQRARLLEKLSNRMDSEGVLRLVESSSRSQHRNREAAVQKLVELTASALYVPPKRKPTRPTRASREQRLESKRRRGQVKKLRGPVKPTE